MTTITSLIAAKKSASRVLVATTVGALVVMTATPARAAYVILKNNPDVKIEGTDISWHKSDNTIVVKQGPVTKAFQRDAVLVAEADAPPEFAAGMQAFSAKQYQKTIDTMDAIARDKAGVEVDKMARIVMAKAYIGLDKAGEAVSQFDEIFKVYDTANKDSKIELEYANALLAAKQYGKLETVLGEIIQNGPRDAAAKAQNMRGDMKMTQSQPDAALLDYMRTAVFFESEEIAAPEGLYKAADILSKKGDAVRAKKLFKQILDEYKESSSPYVAKAQGRA